jgi:hypothetical protein
MSLSIVGASLATPFALSPREHVLFTRARLPGPATSPFLLPDDRRRRVYHCAWIDVAMPIEERILWLARAALDDALRPLDDAGIVDVALSLVLPAPRPGLDKAAIGRAATAIQGARRFAEVTIYRGEAGAIAGLADALALPDRQAAPTVILAADSFIDRAWLTHLELHPETRWEAPRPTPSEGAAAIVVLPSRRGDQLGLRPLGTVNAAATGLGAAHDDNDEPVDAVVMTGLIERAAPPRVYYAFGQDTLDPLRREDWHRAVARHRERFWECQHVCTEARAGALGAASSAASVVAGLFTLRLYAEPERLPRDAPFVAWALSRDGTRGLASVSVEGA